MSTDWLRLWHEMPTDPKWRVIARKAQQPIALVIAVFNFVLVNASTNANERGRTHNLFADDIAAALDVEQASVEAVLAAMQGKVMTGDLLTGWEKRQPKREDSSAERARAWRERKRTQTNASERPDADADADADAEKKEELSPVVPFQTETAYAFEGKTIKLVHADFDRWAKAYFKIPDLATELYGIDDWLTDHPPKNGKWFHATSGMLRRKHEQLVAEQAAEDAQYLRL
jgi:hypothetical protein